MKTIFEKHREMINEVAKYLYEHIPAFKDKFIRSVSMDWENLNSLQKSDFALQAQELHEIFCKHLDKDKEVR